MKIGNDLIGKILRDDKHNRFLDDTDDHFKYETTILSIDLDSVFAQFSSPMVIADIHKAYKGPKFFYDNVVHPTVAKVINHLGTLNDLDNKPFNKILTEGLRKEIEDSVFTSMDSLRSPHSVGVTSDDMVDLCIAYLRIVVPTVINILLEDHRRSVDYDVDEELEVTIYDNCVTTPLPDVKHPTILDVEISYVKAL